MGRRIKGQFVITRHRYLVWLLSSGSPVLPSSDWECNEIAVFGLLLHRNTGGRGLLCFAPQLVYIYHKKITHLSETEAVSHVSNQVTSSNPRNAQIHRCHGGCSFLLSHQLQFACNIFSDSHTMLADLIGIKHFIKNNKMSLCATTADKMNSTI